MNKKKPSVKRKMLEELDKHLGVISPACKAANIDRGTHYDWMKKDPDYKAAVEEIMEKQGDFVETKLLNLINESNPTAIIFYCKTKLKDRGYREGQDITFNGGASVMGVDLSELAENALNNMEGKKDE